MGNRPVCFVHGSAGRWLVVFGGWPNTLFSAGRRTVHANRVRSPEIRSAASLIAMSLGAALSLPAQAAAPTASPREAETEQVIVAATRFDIPLRQSPASVGVISSEDFEQKHNQRVSDALREVPGLSD